MATLFSSVSSALGYLGIRWTNTDEDSYTFLKADMALKNPAVWYAVNKISGHIGQLPLNLHQQVGRTITQPTDHYFYQLMRVRPNAYQSPTIFKKTLTSHALLWGNGYAYIRWQGRRVAELIPLRPDAMAVGLVDGEKVFLYLPKRDERISLWEQLEDPQTETMTFTNDEIFHIQGLGADGICGYSLLSLAREAWEAGLAATQRNLSQLKKGHAGGLVLEVPPGQLRDEAKAREFLHFWRREQDGDANAGKTAMLREGVQAKVLAMSNKDAEFVQTLLIMRQDEALRFMLESILGDDSSVSYSSLVEKNMAYMQNCLNTWLRTWEEECELKLLTKAALRQGYYVKINEGPLLRTDKSTTMQTGALGIQSMILTRNEVRGWFDLNPVTGGDEFINPAITPGTEEEDDEEDSEEETTTTTTANLAAQRQVAHMIGIEMQRVVARTKAPNFLEAIDAFYQEWEPKLADWFEDCGYDRNLASLHCEESKKRLLEVSGSSTEDNLTENVKDCVANWKSRSSILGEIINV